MTNLTRESHLDNNDEDMHCDYLESHRKWPDFGSYQYFVFVAFIRSGRISSVYIVSKWVVGCGLLVTLFLNL